MFRKSIILLALLTVVSAIAFGQELTAREYAKAHGIPNRQSEVTLSTPHACTLSKQHPCIYYGGDIDPNDPQEDGLPNQNTIGLPYFWTYNEIKVPVAFKISAAFTNNLQTYGIIDPRTANWDFRVGLQEFNGGTSIGSGTTPAQLSDTGRNAFGLEEYEIVTRIPMALPKGNVWFDVQPNCTNPDDPVCNQDNPLYFESDTDGLNGINSKFTVTSNTGMGPTFYCQFGSGCPEPMWVGSCFGLGVACGDGMSAGLLK